MSPKKSGVSDGLSALVEQLVNRVLKPLGLLVISPERIRETLDEAAERGRVTRSDANELVAELVRRGRQQLDELLGLGVGGPGEGSDERKPSKAGDKRRAKKHRPKNS
jgi:hypothetical protein